MPRFGRWFRFNAIAPPLGPPIFIGQGISWPEHRAGDVALLMMESANEVLSPGWAKVMEAVEGAGPMRMSIYWKRARSSREPNPRIHGGGAYRLATFRGCLPAGDPVVPALSPALALQSMSS